MKKLDPNMVYVQVWIAYWKPGRRWSHWHNVPTAFDVMFWEAAAEDLGFTSKEAAEEWIEKWLVMATLKEEI